MKNLTSFDLLTRNLTLKIKYHFGNRVRAESLAWLPALNKKCHQKFFKGPWPADYQMVPSPSSNLQLARLKNRRRRNLHLLSYSSVSRFFE